MKVAMVVNRIGPDPRANLRAMERAAGEAAKKGAALVLFPEAASTGLLNNDDPKHDLPLGQTIPGPVTRRLGGAARRHSIHIATGLLEREGETLYDSAVLIGPDGSVILKYRRIDPHWHGPRADAAVYREGGDIPTVRTPLGAFAFLICGDLFDDEITSRAKRLGVDWLLFPFARSFDDCSYNQGRWDKQERPTYCQRAARTGTTVLMANYLAGMRAEDDWSFGGAMAVSPRGEPLATFPLGVPGMLFVDLPK